MFEARWLNSHDPELMLRYVLGKTGDRKLRLFACACVRRIWPMLRDERSREAVHVSERYADRPGGLSQLLQARRNARQAEQMFDQLSRRNASSADVAARWAARAAEATVGDTGWDVARNAAWSAAHAINIAAPAERRAQCELIRDAFGNPFRPESIRPNWLRWNDGCIVKMARSIYDEHRFEEIPVLGDALEEAGCDNEVILWHCRVDTAHARGCWLLDAILGKN